MGVSVDSLTFDCRDPQTVARFWAEVLGYEIVEIDEEGAELRDPAGRGWPIVFLVVPEGKSVKNRLHLDLRPATSMAEEKARVIALVLNTTAGELAAVSDEVHLLRSLDPDGEAVGRVLSL